LFCPTPWAAGLLESRILLTGLKISTAHPPRPTYFRYAKYQPLRSAINIEPFHKPKSRYKDGRFDSTSGILFPAGAGKHFLLHNVGIGYVAHPACLRDPGVKRPGREADYLHLVARSRIIELRIPLTSL
jgi:hypothetical protein